MKTPSSRLSLAALNRMNREAFARALGGVFEHSPWVAEQAWRRAPFASVAALHAAMADAVRAASIQRQLALIRAHPDLAGKAARAGRMTAPSIAEQSSVGLDRLSDAEYARLNRLNAAYRARFGFPFIIAVRQHTKDSLLEAFAARLANSRAGEIETAIAEIFKIARMRLDALVVADQPTADDVEG